MRKSILLIVVLLGLATQVYSQIKTSDLRDKKTNIYFLSYYYEEEPDKIINLRAICRIIKKDSSFCLVDYVPKDLDKTIYCSCYDFTGMPTQFGSEKEMTSIIKDSVRLNFKERDTTLLSSSKKELQNPTSLWFWKYMPYVNETVVVGGIRKNFITNTIDKVDVSYTYLRKEKLKILGKTKGYYLVKSYPLNESEGVYDERWYDMKGILVRERHVVGKNGIRVAELSKIVKPLSIRRVQQGSTD